MIEFNEEELKFLKMLFALGDKIIEWEDTFFTQNDLFALACKLKLEDIVF